MAQKFKKGDVVQLKSGGNKMVVLYYKELLSIEGLQWALSRSSTPMPPSPESHEVMCGWLEGESQKEMQYHEDVLELAK